MKRDGSRSGEVLFPDAIEPFIRACPGPDLAVKALRLMAYQEITGIPGLEPPDDPRTRLGNNREGDGTVSLATLGDVAEALHYSPAYLSRVARRRGYSISLAIRWLRFLRGYVLKQNGLKREAIARSLGLSDASAWSRSVKDLTGKAPSQLPRLSLSDWVLEARRRVFIVPLRTPKAEKEDS